MSFKTSHRFAAAAPALGAALVLSAGAQIPAFPGAEGFGSFANGGRGGDVYIVTNLNASGTGPFADAVTTAPASGRTIVFAVSGHIRLPSGSGGGLSINGSKISVAGQTARAGRGENTLGNAWSRDRRSRPSCRLPRDE